MKCVGAPANDPFATARLIETAAERRVDELLRQGRPETPEGEPLDVLAEESAKDPLFKKIADDYLNFRKQYAVWGEAQAMKPTYLPKGAAKP